MSGRDPIYPLIDAPLASATDVGSGVAIRELIALADEGRTPMVLDVARRCGAAVRAKTIVDLSAAHIGKRVVVAFEEGDPLRPIVMGVVVGEIGWPARESPHSVEIDGDGEQMVIRARSRLVLRCGKASITLTSDGKVLIDGAYVLTRSTGVNRMKGGSVQLN